MKRTAIIMALIAGLGSGTVVVSPNAQAQSTCSIDYQVISQWSTGSVNKVVVTNDGPPLTEWQLSWDFPANERITSMYNGTYAQSGESVVVNNAAWNGGVATGATFEVGFGLSDPSGETPLVLLNGIDCNGESTPPDMDQDGVPDSEDAFPDDPNEWADTDGDGVGDNGDAFPDDPAETRDTDGDGVGDNADAFPDDPSRHEPLPGEMAFSLDASDSFINFVTTKKVHVVEAHRFDALSGGITGNGVATLEVDLDSVNTGIDIRDERMRNLLFETTLFPRATASLSVDLDAIEALEVGEATVLAVQAMLGMHGVVGVIASELMVQRVSSSRIMVKNVSPLLIQADDYSLESGVEALRQAADLDTISNAVPVDFVLFYDAL